jgi:hypothetical protein
MEKFLLAAVALAGCFYLYLNQVYDPKMELFKNTREEIQAVQQEITGLSEPIGLGRMTERVAEEKRQFQELEARVAELNSKKVQEVAVGSRAVKEIKELALRNGLKINDLRIIRLDGAEEKAAAQKSSSARQETSSAGNQSGGQKDVVTTGDVPLPEAVTRMEWTEYILSLEGRHRGLVGFVRDLGEKMPNYVVIKSIGVKMDDETGRLKIAMTLMI